MATSEYALGRVAQSISTGEAALAALRQTLADRDPRVIALMEQLSRWRQEA